MGATVRRGIALAITGIGLGGAALLASGAAEAATPSTAPATGAAASGPVCRYVVDAEHGLHVRQIPNGKILGILPDGKIVFAKKCNNPRGWVKLRGGVKPSWLLKYVYRPYLHRH
ncbi:hypothetical protein [Actinomadura rupiterrae]|uniref:hypothetical protein n=1 Tax=Actinomadura rupiterrae TaxID=559627 RepID=UPI0020A335D8|nr:hypothetical protein [Actinomadura rupiterrae]MCP2335173.1 hypothetical protein [Actinomadura rupiterrae]